MYIHIVYIYRYIHIYIHSFPLFILSSCSSATLRIFGVRFRVYATLHPRPPSQKSARKPKRAKLPGTISTTCSLSHPVCTGTGRQVQLYVPSRLKNECPTPNRKPSRRFLEPFKELFKELVKESNPEAKVITRLIPSSAILCSCWSESEKNLGSGPLIWPGPSRALRVRCRRLLQECCKGSIKEFWKSYIRLLDGALQGFFFLGSLLKP